ncbi:MAG: hypothetical protein HY763_06480 [Planctomycetes bacterium]|nr:hypothetical protein [Planctomycetota bacterium]
MRRRHSIFRVAALFATGGFLCQLVGCGSGLLPLALSLAESLVLNTLLGGVTGP